MLLISKSFKELYSKNPLPTPSPSSASTSSIITNSYKGASSPTSPTLSSPTSNKYNNYNKNNEETTDIISKLSNKAKINATKILKQPLSNTTKFSLSDFKQKSQSIKINIKDFQSARDASLLTPSSEELDSSKSQKKLKSVTSKDNKYNNTYKLSPYIVTDVDLNNIDFELNNKIKSNSTAGNNIKLMLSSNISIVNIH